MIRQTHFKKNFTKRGQEATLSILIPSSLINAMSMRAEQGRRSITLQSRIITGKNSAGIFCSAIHKAECRLCENAVVLNRRTLICCRHLFEGD